MTRSWINLIAGAWAIFSGFFVYFLHPVNFLLIGLFMAVFGFWTNRNEWQGIVNGIIGLWLILSAFVPSLMAQWNLIIAGIVVFILALWRMSSVQKMRRQTPHAAPG